VKFKIAGNPCSWMPLEVVSRMLARLMEIQAELGENRVLVDKNGHLPLNQAGDCKKVRKKGKI